MKFTLFSLLISALFLLIGCGGGALTRPPQSEIDTFLEQNEDLSPTDRQVIHSGRFDIGISQKTLQFLLGEPNEIETVRQPWGKQQHWIYGRGKGHKVFILEGDNVVGIRE